MEFVHLHNHTHYSLLDGLTKLEDLVDVAIEQGSKAIAKTDHGVMYGTVEFYKAAKTKDIKPIIGCEAYIHPISRFNRDKDSKYFHLILLAYNDEGYKNLLYLTTIANLEGFYYKPRIDFELLKEHSKGLIASSACLQGQVAQSVMYGEPEKTIEIIKKYQQIFGQENFFLELQHHPEIPAQDQANKKLIEFSKLTNAPLIITNDAHYAKKDDAEAHDVLICIQTQKKVQDEDRMKYPGDFSLKNPEILKQAFPDLPDAFKNTVEIANRCEINIHLGQNLIPAFQTPFNKDPYDYLKELCYQGLKERYGDNPSEETFSRLEYELDIIHKMGFDTYFLIVQDFISYAKSQGIVVGPGRGSAAGSIIAYCLKITDLDPLRYGLLFERFLNPERVSMPDIDIDFADTRRGEVLNYVSEKYGKNHVAQIITFGTMAARAAVRDAGSALGYPYAEVDSVSKIIPPPILGKHQPLKLSIETDPELKLRYQKEPRVKKLMDTAIKLEGTIRHVGTHACAVVISREPLINYCPIQKAIGEGEEGLITQYPMKPLETIGLLKMDFLGLRNLTIIETTLNLIKNRYEEKIILTQIPMDDEKTFILLKNGETTGVFQMESAGMKRYLKQLEPTSFEDIIAMISLYRPGPMDWIPDYIERKHGRKEVKYLHNSLEEVLKETNGIAIYQEQILQIAQKFAGFSLGEADILRRAIGKKIPKELADQRKKLIDGAKNLGHNEKLAIEIFEKVIEPFAGYGFNKSHAACYALISYQTAYLKANYPVEYMTALLSADADNTDRIIIEINECERMNIKVLPPAVNESNSDFTVIDNKTIRFGLNAIKGIGAQSTEIILHEREQKGGFNTFENFLKRVPSKQINKKNLESLAYSGALDELIERNTVINNIEEITKFAKSCQEDSHENQIDIFSLMPTNGDEHVTLKLKKTHPAKDLEKLMHEKKYLGLYVSRHPLQGLTQYLKKKGRLIKTIDKKFTDKLIKIAGMIVESKRVYTKSGKPMFYGMIEDTTGRLPFVVFPNTYEQIKDNLQEDKLIFLQGRIDNRRDGMQLACQEAKTLSLENAIERAKQEGLYDPREKINRFNQNNEESLPANGKTEEMNNSENTFIIKIPSITTPKNLQNLKKLLQENPGTITIEMHILSPNEIKKIRLPEKVNINDDLKKKIAEIVTNEI